MVGLVIVGHLIYKVDLRFILLISAIIAGFTAYFSGVKVDKMFLLKFFFAALCNSKNKSITLPLIEVKSVPDSFGQHLEIEHDVRGDKMTLKIKGKENLIVLPKGEIIQN